MLSTRIIKNAGNFNVSFLRSFSAFPSRFAQSSLNQSELLSCVAVSKCEKYDLSIAKKLLTKNQFPVKCLDGGIYTHINNSDVFVLAIGSVVSWGKNEQQASETLPLLTAAELGDQLELESEDMDFTLSKDSSGLSGDVINVRSANEKPEIADMLTFSYAMAKHAKLSAMEVKADKMLLGVKHISKTMSSGHKPSLKTKEVDILTGKLLELRGALNLYSEITEVPDLYWSYPQQEQLYEQLSNHLDVPKRADMLNKKLDYASYTLSVLRSHLSETIGLRLEWTIIILIMVEVAIEIKNFVL